MPSAPVLPRDRRAKGYEMMPKERALAAHFSIATHDWPAESRQNFIDCIIAALDEAREDGIAAALVSLESA